MENRTPGGLLAGALRYWRDRKRLTAQEVADRVATIGGKLTRQAISKIENGDRGVSIDEIVLLGRALGIAPILLVFPVGHENAVEVLPGHVVDAVDAALWFTGEMPFPGPDIVTEDEEYEQGAIAIRLFREHHHLERDRRNAARRLESEQKRQREREPRERESEPEEVRQALAGELRRREIALSGAEHVLYEKRREMRRHELTPPALPPELEHLDTNPLTRVIARYYEDQEQEGGEK